ncbi:MAG: hypothetical protein EBS29_06985 [Chloroflexia bacterium]|nr:hypothetical protein [Chloroflexia bacterium]
MAELPPDGSATGRSTVHAGAPRIFPFNTIIIPNNTHLLIKHLCAIQRALQKGVQSVVNDD